jgi:hypothetical protein
VVARVAPRGHTLEQHLEFEEALLFALDGEARVPGVARGRVLAAQAPRVAQEVGVGVAHAP